MSSKKTVAPVAPSDVEILATAETRFTREAALAAGADVTTARDYATEALTAWNAAEREAGRVYGRASVFAAMAAAAAVKSGLLVETRAKDAGDGVKDAKQWGEAWITASKPDGVSRQMVVTWIRAGEAFLDWGVDPESSEGKRLLGGLAQASLWTAERKAIAEAVAETPDAAPEAVAEMVTARIAEVRERQEAKEAEAKRAREEEAARKAKELKEALAKGTTAKVTAPESLADRVVVAEQIIAGLRPTVKAERAILEDLAARIALALDGEAVAS